MTTSYPSGLGTSVGYTAEVTVGTALTTSMRWLQHDKATFEYKKGTVTSVGLHQGLYQQGKRRNILTKQASGQLTMDVVANKMGLLFKHALGSSATAASMAGGSGAAYQQIHTPGDTYGLGLTIQVNKPGNQGTLQQFTYSGSKVTDWQLSVARGGIAKFDLGIDAWLEDTTTSLASVSYVATDVLHFAQGALTLAGTVSGSPYVVSAGTTPTALVQDVTIKGTNPLRVDRFNIGSTTKAEQLANNWRTITGTVTLEFNSLESVLYTAFTADTAQALHFSLTGGVIPNGGTNHELVDVILPQVYLDTDMIDITGPDILTQKVNFTALDDGTTTPIQIVYQSSDVAV